MSGPARSDDSGLAGADNGKQGGRACRARDYMTGESAVSEQKVAEVAELGTQTGREALANARRVVVKIGSALLTDDGRGLDDAGIGR